MVQVSDFFLVIYSQEEALKILNGQNQVFSEIFRSQISTYGSNR
jgi:hypothetical protein